eukprot:TRINITY_DN14429_c0_g1_i1.p1 TRINITY_DN14429_c0_g1~~TRINITY_DN14429_c0_g1_i1.p1  ORF type:complete len:306 (-),score=71.26 TRINITY_DN14429_c0_g1_i1:189-1052(-)
MIDYYDVLGIGLDADVEEIKKAFKRASLQTHPDKVGSASNAAERFNEVKQARAVLEDPERRKIYDTFGCDLGEERPEMEVWTIGLSTILSPLGAFLLKTLVARLALWIIAWSWIGNSLMAIGLAAVGLYAADFKYKEVSVRSPEVLPILLNIGIVDIVVLLYWLWPLLADTVTVMYLVTEMFGLQIFLEDWRIAAGGGLGSLFLAWLVRGWWLWIVGAEIGIGLVMLVALTVASGMMRLWIDTVQAQRGDKLKEWRLSMRQERKRLNDENAELQRKVQSLEQQLGRK